MRRFLFVVNVLIAIAFIAACVVFYWFFYRPLPQTSGTLETFVAQPVEVVRDALGVPHITARTEEDAWFAQGYVTAGDRLWQMDSLRRLAAGDLAEIVGPVALDADRDARRLRLRRTAEEIYAVLPVRDKAAYAAYSRGVNAWIESHRGSYSFEFAALGYDPRPWSTVDGILISLQMFRTLTMDWKTKLLKEQMMRTGEPEKVAFLFPTWTGAEFTPGADIHPGSNAWAVAGSHTASGKPLLSNDTHLEFSLPGIWYMAHLKAPGLNVTGASLPGLPGIVLGHNERIAWGVTNLGFDVQDLYNERIDTRTGQYVFENKVAQARQERELIRIKGKGAEETVNWVTNHGPVVESVPGRVVTLKWTAYDPSIYHNVFIAIDRARNWDEFRTALADYGGPGQNFAYADVDGNIGYQAAGKLPIRRNYTGDLPVDGSTGQNEWDGYIPFDSLPRSYNPKSGFVVTANQNPFPPDYAYHVTGNFASPYRSRQILAMLQSSGNKLGPADNLRIQKDVYSAFSRFLARQVVAAYDKRGATNPAFTDAIALLRTWDGQMDKERAEPFIVTMVFQYLRKAVAERASPGTGAAYDLQIASAAIEKLLRERPAGWFGDYNEVLLRCLADGMEEGKRLQGDDPKRWKWGKYMFLQVDHPVGARIPWIGSYFTLGPVPMSGGSTTVKQTTRKLGPSERIDVSLANWDDSLANLPIGESGNPGWAIWTVPFRVSIGSSHFWDQWDAYYEGRSFPMPFRSVKAESTLTLTPAK